MLSGDDEKKDGLLVCKECQKEMGALQFADSDARTERKEWTEKEDSFAEGVKNAESKSAQREEYLKSQTHCLHIDGKTVKRCRRMVYRKSGYCYAHQRE